MNWDSIWGIIIGGGVTGGVALAGHIINRRTSIDTKNIDDRSKFQADLMKQLEDTKEEYAAFKKECRAEIDEMKRVVRFMQKREFSFIRLLTTIDSELRVLNLHLLVHKQTLEREANVPSDKIESQMKQICDSVTRIQSAVEKEEKHLLDDSESGNDSLPDSKLKGEKG
jgi:hypothetical protein